MTVHRTHFDRREFCAIAGTALVSFAVGSSCRAGGSLISSDGRLTVRPHKVVKSGGSGRITLGLDQDRDAVLQLPSTAIANVPLLIMLHGAGQTADDMFGYLGSTNEEAGVAVLAPHSRDYTWDGIGGSFGRDIDFLNQALERTFDIAAVDPARIVLGGFSDGASYAVSLGLINGDVFSRVLAFSPGFVVDGFPRGKPRIFISHGTRDHILPINSCGRRIALGLTARGYDVTFREFDGDHEIPSAIAREGMSWIKA